MADAWGEEAFMRLLLRLLGVLAGLLALATPASAAFFSYTTLDVPGAANTLAFGINNAGQIVGTYNNGGSTGSAFIVSGGSITSFAMPGALRTAALDINNHGQVVGYYEVQGPFDIPSHGFYRD